MAEYTGSGLYVKFGSTELLSDFRTFNPNEEIGLVDASAGADANRTYLSTLKDGTATLQLVAQTDGTAIWDAHVVGTSGTLEWGEEGTASGKQRHYATAIAQSRSKDIPYDDLVIYNFDYQFSGAVTDTVYPA